MSLIAEFTWGQCILGWGIVLVCGLLILVVLVQQASGGGLVGAFGGGGGGGAFGAKTGDVFTVFTCALAGLFLTLAVAGNYIFRPSVPTQASVIASPTTPLPSAPPPTPFQPLSTTSDGESSPAEGSPLGSTTTGDEP